MADLQGKTAVVTGGAGGIGQAMGRRFGREGMKVVLADVLAAPLDEAARGLAGEGIQAGGGGGRAAALAYDWWGGGGGGGGGRPPPRRAGVCVVKKTGGTGGVSEGY